MYKIYKLIKIENKGRISYKLSHKDETLFFLSEASMIWHFKNVIKVNDREVKKILTIMTFDNSVTLNIGA